MPTPLGTLSLPYLNVRAAPRTSAGTSMSAFCLSRRSTSSALPRFRHDVSVRHHWYLTRREHTQWTSGSQPGPYRPQWAIGPRRAAIEGSDRAVTKNIDASLCLICEILWGQNSVGRISHAETPPHTLPTPLFTSLKMFGCDCYQIAVIATRLLWLVPDCW